MADYNNLTETYENDADDELEESMEKQHELQQDFLEDAPSYKRKDDLFSLFWRVINIPDSSKVGNLDKTELGMINISVRDCQKIALLGHTLNHPGFANFFWNQAQIILKTSSSKKGWLPELFVSQRKFQTKAHGSTETLGPELTQETAPQVRRKGIFSRR